MTWNELFAAARPPPTLFRSDTTSFEAVSGWCIASLGIWCWIAAWFSTGFFPALSQLAGLEPLAGAMLIAWGVRHAVGAHSHNKRARARRALLLAAFLSFVAALVWQQRGWYMPGIPVAIVTIAAHCWVFLRLTGRL